MSACAVEFQLNFYSSGPSLIVQLARMVVFLVILFASTRLEKGGITLFNRWLLAIFLEIWGWNHEMKSLSLSSLQNLNILYLSRRVVNFSSSIIWIFDTWALWDWMVCKLINLGSGLAFMLTIASLIVVDFFFFSSNQNPQISRIFGSLNQSSDILKSSPMDLFYEFTFFINLLDISLNLLP